jgi:hypothetical protein
MTNILAALIWGVVSATMVCKTSGNPFSNSYRAPWVD